MFCLHVYIHVYSACEEQKRALYPLELESPRLWAVMWVLRTKPRSSRRVAHTLTIDHLVNAYTPILVFLWMCVCVLRDHIQGASLLSHIPSPFVCNFTLFYDLINILPSSLPLSLGIFCILKVLVYSSYPKSWELNTRSYTCQGAIHHWPVFPGSYTAFITQCTWQNYRYTCNTNPQGG